jgi:UDP-N-acetylmuramoyl-tripeptide--D-alanyl-D-alanine ligase
MTALWTAHDLLEASGGGMATSFAADGVSIDTRTLQPNDLFVALHGENGDGHDHVVAALAAGAAGAMVDRDLAPVTRLLRVDDTLAGLHRLGGYARQRFAGRLVAVTGSVGKTTTKEMLRCILQGIGRTHAAVASYNNHWGLPLTLARMPRDTVFCVAEIGMNHPGEIAPLARLARPHVAVITTIEPAHIGFLGSIEAIADEKSSILRGLEAGGIAVLPADSPQLARLRAAAGDARIVTFGMAPEADVRLTALTADANGSDVVSEIGGRPLRFRLNAPGRHMAMNAMAALAAAIELARLVPGDHASLAHALESFAPLAGRGARRQIAVPGGTALLLDESYNGNPASMRAALEVLRLQPSQRRLAVLGDMLELGAHAAREHRALADAVMASADRLFACGPLMRELFMAIPESRRGAHAADAAALTSIVARSVTAGDTILIKGSLGSRMKLVVNALDQSVEAA